MALARMVIPFLFFLVLTSVELSASADAGRVMRGKVSCLDCDSGHDLSGIMVLAKCDKVEKLVIATTTIDGSFEAELPSPTSSGCIAKLTGGSNQLYAARSTVVAKIVEAGDGGYTISTPLAFSTTCRVVATKPRNCELRSSKTVDLPLPREWGLAPSSYYVPFFPIIGVP